MKRPGLRSRRDTARLERFRSCCIRCWVEHAFQACIPRLQKGRGFSRIQRQLSNAPLKRCSTRIHQLKIGSSRRSEALLTIQAEYNNPESLRCPARSEEHTSELQSLRHRVCRLLLE